MLSAAVLLAGSVPARADDELDAALRRKQELEQAVQVTRQNAERYRTVAGQYLSAVNAANARIGELAVQQGSAQSEAQALGFEIRIAEEQLQLVSFQLGETRAFVDSLRAQGDELDRQLARRQALYADHLRAAYRQVRVTPLEMLLASSSLTEFASRLQATVLLNRQDAQLAADIQALRASTARQRDDLAGKETEILGLQDQITTQRERLAKEKARYDELVREADAAIATQSALRGEAATNRSQAQRNAQQAAAEAARLNKQLEEAEAAYEELAARLAARSGLGAFDGQRVALWPIRGPVTSGYGPRWGGFHNGIDIAAPKFTPVRAASSGLVVTVGRPYVAAGDTAVVVIIAHGYNFSTLYGHLDDRRWPPVQVGQRVNAGDVIGYVGLTGWTTGPHVHFMTIANSRARDPRPYLP